MIEFSMASIVIIDLAMRKSLSNRPALELAYWFHRDELEDVDIYTFHSPDRESCASKVTRFLLIALHCSYFFTRSLTTTSDPSPFRKISFKSLVKGLVETICRSTPRNASYAYWRAPKVIVTAFEPFKGS